MNLKIKELREEFHLTQKELAEKIDNVQRNISNWENGTSEPDCETLIKLADIFQVSLDELFGRENIPESETNDDIDNLTIHRLINKLNSQQKKALIIFLNNI